MKQRNAERHSFFTENDLVSTPKCEKNEQVAVPTAQALLIAVRGTQRVPKGGMKATV